MASVDDFPFDDFDFNLEDVSDGLLAMIEVAADMFRDSRDPYFAGKLTAVAGGGMVQITDHLLGLDVSFASTLHRNDLIRSCRTSLDDCEPERRPPIERFIKYLEAENETDKPSRWAESHIEWINRVLAERMHKPVAVAVSEFLQNPGCSLDRTTKTTYYLSWHEAALEIAIALLVEYACWLGGSRYRSENELDGDKFDRWAYFWSKTDWEEVLAGLRQERVILEATLAASGPNGEPQDAAPGNEQETPEEPAAAGGEATPLEASEPKQDTPTVPVAGHSGPSAESAARPREESFAARRLVFLLGRIRNGARKTLDAIQSKAFCGSLNEVLPVTPKDVNAAVSYLVELGCHEEAQQLRDEWERSWKEGGFHQVLMRDKPPALDYSASSDDPDDPEVARVKQVNADRLADHQRKIGDQRGIAIDAFSALLKHVDDLIEAVESMFRGNDKEAAKDAKFQWTVPMLEGYVFALLKEVEDPTERVAAKRIAAKSGKRKPSRTTLRKTYAWQNRPQKTPKARTTNETQSGVSPAQNAAVAMSHEEATAAVLDIEEKLHRQLVDDERDAVTWTLQQAGADEKDRDEAIRQLILGFRSDDM